MKCLFSACIFLMIVQNGCAQNIDEREIANLSRNSCVKIICPKGVTGTGFLISSQYVVTNWHIAARKDSITDVRAISVLTASGEVIKCNGLMATTNEQFKYMEENDFVILRLERKASSVSIVTLAPIEELNSVRVLDTVIFSGYPIDVPVMVTHRGSVSGFHGNAVYLNSSINSGSSGSAVLNRKGKLIAIINFKQGSISQVEKQLQLMERAVQEHPDVGFNFSGKFSDSTVVQANNLQMEVATLQLLRKFMETGIGGAFSAFHLSEYIRQVGIKLD